MTANVRIEEIYEVNNLSSHLGGKKKQCKPKISRRKDILKIRAGINKIENKVQ